ncbi:ATP-binding protein [Candidatus Symbiobacter mobilis]|uniref:AAA-ATPase-like domain-containing protein n=1 Tax=Candidatus Symbiobacter mobilis CR TaxID=946483 RepID=U5ND17_9BURK|nr:ATP-binding protein [Candidatus Symbiobacter mobilis]AGX88133.1 hypothetical protein Cenrod_2062 [Candidatus Symbiobacter mobilis CR]
MTAPVPARRKLPIGIQNFRQMREEGYYYVDKTGYALDLIERGKYFFLSRPRRFGKSLFLDTIKELYEGHRELFVGLEAEERWDWGRQYPVVRLSFGAGVLGSQADLAEHLHLQLTHLERRFGLTSTFTHPRSRFIDLLVQIHALHQQRVVVLIDEYDKPILDNLSSQRTDAARELRDALRDIYSVIKDCDEHLQFAMLTGVSKFSKVNLFSGLNNLQDITLDARYSALCGYTDDDIDTVFAPELEGLDREEIRRWYNGYNWLGTSVYNPFDLLLLFETREFRAYWFETGTPTFLIDLLLQRHIFTPNLGHLVATETLLSTFDVDNIPIEALMFQAGYLTIASTSPTPGRWECTLQYPNREVRMGTNELLLHALLHGRTTPPAGNMVRLLQANDFVGMQAVLTALFESIPYEWFTNNPIARYEGYYASVFYSYFAALGLDVQAEPSSNAGRLDMAVRCNGLVVLFEFKVVEWEPEGRALAQIKEKGYAKPYLAEGVDVVLVGVEFSAERRSVVGFEVEKVTSTRKP